MSRKEQKTSQERRPRAVSPHPSKGRKPTLPELLLDEECSDHSSEEKDPEVQSSGKLKARSDSSDDHNESEEGSETYGHESLEAPKPLVDPNFRSKFIGKSRSAQGSFANIPSLLRKASASGPASASYQATGTMDTAHGTLATSRGTGRDAFTNVTAPLKAPAAAGPEAPSDNDAQPLPRTKSQLTLLLERERNRAASQEPMSRNSEP